MKLPGAATAAALFTCLAFAACGRHASVAQYASDAGFGMPSPQPGSPIADAGITPAPLPSTPSPAPSPSAPPGTPPPGTSSPAPGSPTPPPMNR